PLPQPATGMEAPQAAPQQALRPEPAPAAMPPASFAAEDIQEWLMEQIASQLDLSPDDIDPRRTFESYTLDSTRALLILTRLEKRLALKLSPTLIWNYPTIETLAAQLCKMASVKKIDMQTAHTT
ncbi:acyl carrier protein, partial [Chromobacterium subtsugae]